MDTQSLNIAQIQYTMRVFLHSNGVQCSQQRDLEALLSTHTPFTVICQNAHNYSKYTHFICSHTSVYLHWLSITLLERIISFHPCYEPRSSRPIFLTTWGKGDTQGEAFEYKCAAACLSPWAAEMSGMASGALHVYVRVARICGPRTCSHMP